MLEHFRKAQVCERNGEMARATYHFEMARRLAKSPKNREVLKFRELVCIMAMKGAA